MTASRYSPNWIDEEATPLWRVFLDPRGRITRRSYWLYGVLVLLGMGLLCHVLLAIARVPELKAEHIVNALLLWPAVAINAKRWHDCGKSGWWSLMALVPVVGAVCMLLHNGLLKGQPGANRFGQAPSAAAINTAL